MTWALQWQPQGKLASVTPNLVHPLVHAPRSISSSSHSVLQNSTFVAQQHTKNTKVHNNKSTRNKKLFLHILIIDNAHVVL
jgi:hypothetical protein